MKWDLFISDAAVVYGTHLENKMQAMCGCPALTIDMVDFVISCTFLIFLFLALGFSHLLATYANIAS